MNVNVYDFDNTIYDGETLVDFILYFVRRDIRIWRYIPKLIVIAIKDGLHLFTVEEAIDAYASFLEGYYVKIGDISAAVVDFGIKTSIKSSLGIKPCKKKAILSFPDQRIFA